MKLNIYQEEWSKNWFISAWGTRILLWHSHGRANSAARLNQMLYYIVQVSKYVVTDSQIKDTNSEKFEIYYNIVDEEFRKNMVRSGISGAVLVDSAEHATELINWLNGSELLEFIKGQFK